MSSDEKIDLTFLKKLQRGVEPTIKPGETALEAIRRTEAERVASMIQNPDKPQSPSSPSQSEVVFYRGYKLPRDFFTMLAISLLQMKNNDIDEIVRAFGFEMKDLDGKSISFRQQRTRRSRRRRKRK